MTAADTIRLKARLTGWFWLGTIVTGVVGEFLIRGALVSQDPARTAAGVVAAGELARISIVANLLTNISYAGVTILLYELMAPVSRTVARFGLFFGTLGLATGFIAVLAQITQLALLGAHWNGASAEQLQLLSYVAAATRTWVFPIGMTLFGVQMATTGWLIARSTFLPRLIGIMLTIGGSTYIAGSLLIILFPSLPLLVPIMMATALLGEGTLTAWLIFKAVDVPRWEAACRTGSGSPLLPSLVG